MDDFRCTLLKLGVTTARIQNKVIEDQQREIDELREDPHVAIVARSTMIWELMERVGGLEKMYLQLTNIIAERDLIIKGLLYEINELNKLKEE